MAANSDDLRRYRANLQGEVDGAALYGALADAESDPKLSGVYRRLASIESAHGDFWRGRLAKAGAPPLFTCIAQDDRLLFRVVEGLYHDWSEADRPAELHIFRRGGHGFGMVKQGAPADGWVDLFGAWLKDLGF